MSEGIAAIREANITANKNSVKNSNESTKNNSNAASSDKLDLLAISPSISSGLAHQLALGRPLDNDSQSITTALTTSTANTVSRTTTPYKSTPAQTATGASSSAKNKPFKIPNRIIPHSRATTASSRASTASATTRPTTASNLNSRESTLHYNKAHASRPPTASNAYSIVNGSLIGSTTSQSVCSISTIGQGGVESVLDYSSVRTDGDETQPVRFRRRAVDPIYPPGTAQKFGVEAIAKIHQHEEAFRISCVTGNLVSGADHCTPSPHPFPFPRRRTQKY